ncbi:aspartate/glutamate racemase family protein [Streptomyces sp. NPDC051561]|uniref:aspartate/glutamate racemase family protein n=1 Tax=Streptomyces sp. NPDC051561 TaxID=3365658 RepID=UPI00378E07B1
MPTGENRARAHSRAPHSPAALLGVLGGMGPLATAHFYRCLIERTPAGRDQEHLPVAIWADPTVPDRTDALLGQGPSPLQAMLTGLSWLAQAGATCVAIPCNTAHAYRNALRDHTDLEVLDMVSIALRACQARKPSLRNVGILATEGTRQARLYETAADRLGLRITHVTQTTQTQHVNSAITAVKQGHQLTPARAHITAAAAELHDAGADIVIAACTEIPLASDEAQKILPVLDSTAALAEHALTVLMPDVQQVGQADPHL